MWLRTQVQLKHRFRLTASLIQYDDIYHDGLSPSTTDLRELTQYKYAKQTVLPKYLNVMASLTSFLTN